MHPSAPVTRKRSLPAGVGHIAAPTRSNRQVFSSLPMPSISTTTFPVVEEPRRIAKRADTRRRAGGDDVAGLERECLRAVADDLGDREVHLRRVRVLEGLALDEAADGQPLRVGDLVGGHEDRAHRAERVERLAADPLPIAELEVPCRDVVETGVSKDMLEGAVRRDPARGPTDDDRELGLVIDLVREHRVPADLRAGANDRARPFGEDQRRGRRVDAFLDGMFSVVAPDGHHLAGSRDGAR